MKSVYKCWRPTNSISALLGKVIRLVLVVTTATGLVACTAPAETQPEAPMPIVQGNQLRFPAGHPQLALLTTTAAAPGKSITIELPAKLVWDESRTQRIYAAFAGRVSAIHADLGQRVHAGSQLATLASPEFGQAQADTVKAQIDARQAQRALDRARELFSIGVMARKDFEQAESDAARTQAEAARAEARTRLYGSSTGVNQQLALVSQLNGIVVERNLNPGQELRPDQSGPGMPAAFVVSDPSSLWVQIDAREAEVGSLRVGAAFTLVVPALGNRRVAGKVVAVSDFIDPSTRTIKVRGLVDNTDRALKAEMLAVAQIERQMGSGVLVPASAVMLRGNGGNGGGGDGTNNSKRVFVETAAGVFEPRDVVLSYQGPREVIVAKGLEVGEKVVSENGLILARQFRLASEGAPNAPAAAASGESAAKK